MEKKIGHTPGPWRNGTRKPLVYKNDPIFYWADILAGGVRVARAVGVGSAHTEANRAFILRACNSHEELLSSLKYTREMICLDWTRCDDESGEECAGAKCHNRIHRAIVMIDAALSKIEGGGE